MLVAFSLKTKRTNMWYIRDMLKIKRFLSWWLACWCFSKWVPHLHQEDALQETRSCLSSLNSVSFRKSDSRSASWNYHNSWWNVFVIFSSTSRQHLQFLCKTSLSVNRASNNKWYRNQCFVHSSFIIWQDKMFDELSSWQQLRRICCLHQRWNLKIFNLRLIASLSLGQETFNFLFLHFL
jgi:hypothetical protein